MDDLRWDLSSIYTGFDSDEYKMKFKEVQKEIEEFSKLELTDDFDFSVVKFLNSVNSLYENIYPLGAYANLRYASDSTDETAYKNLSKIEDMSSDLTGPFVKFQKWLAQFDEQKILKSEIPEIVEHKFFLTETQKEAKYLLSDAEEILLSKLQTVGSNAWSSLHTKLTSELMIDFKLDDETKEYSLSMIRNFAFHEKQSVRKRAYEAEIKGYEKIEECVGAALNAIKGEVNITSTQRGFNSSLEESAFKSKLNLNSINAMFEAIEEKLPVFRKYLKQKAYLLGHKNGLPFYDLFAPISKKSPTYTFEECKEFIIRNFGSFSEELSEFAKTFFNNRWVDVYPRKGKTGGAFCAYIAGMKQSRILTNFDGSFSDVSTLAHELGHGYHNSCIYDESMLNSDYPMPVAETASIFCETIITDASIKEAKDEEAIFILEKSIENSTQIIVDIFSRFLFEKSLFQERKDSPLSVRELKELMQKAQLQTYGDGLDPEYLHPFMWVCKPHYYSADFSYYNYPYTFGLLFGKGVYAMYKNGEPGFTDKYKNLLNNTVKMNAVDLASTLDIDINAKEFWLKSLSMIEEEIDEFIALTKNR